MVNFSFVSQQKYKGINDDERLKIRLEFNAAGNFHREILLTVDERTTDGFDKGFEAVIAEEYPNDMYWILDEDKLIIQAIGELSEERVLPIGIRSKGDDPIVIKVHSIMNPYADMGVYLRDNGTLETYDILNETFSITLEEGEYNDKYSVVFKPKVEIEETPVQEEEIERIREEDQGQVLGISSEEVIDDLVVFADDYNGLLRIKRPEEMIINKILFFNMIGQQLGAWKTQLDDSQIHLPIHVNAGVYVMLFETNEGRILKKIIVK